MITVLTLLKVKPSPNGEQHGERPFWREMGAQYLDAWLANVERYVPQPHRVVVMTDSHAAIPDGVTTRQLAIEIDAPGFWAKLNMFRPEVSSGKCLYLDLDNVITAPLDALCALEPDPLIMLDDRNVPRLPNGSTILFDAERCRTIWRNYAFNPKHCHQTYVVRGNDYSWAYDQAYIAGWTGESLRLFQDLLPDGYCLNAYSELPKADDWREAHLIFGCGAAKPHTSNHPAFSLE